MTLLSNRFTTGIKARPVSGTAVGPLGKALADIRDDLKSMFDRVIIEIGNAALPGQRLSTVHTSKAVTASGAISVENMLSGKLRLTPDAADYTLTTPTAAAIITELTARNSNSADGDSIETTIFNLGTEGRHLILAAGTDVTLLGRSYVIPALNGCIRLLIRRASSTTVTIEVLSGGGVQHLDVFGSTTSLPVVKSQARTDKAIAANTTLTYAETLVRLLNLTPDAAGYTVTFPTATNIATGLLAAKGYALESGDTVRIRVRNSGTDAVTLAGNTNSTYSGSTTLAGSTVAEFDIRNTGNAITPACTIERVG